jgi:hypothetical protein
MVALGFIYLVFMSHLSYILLEQREEFYKDKNFWLILLGLIVSVYLTVMIFIGF